MSDVLHGTEYFPPGLPLMVQKAEVGHHNISPHRHDFVEIVYVSRGTANHQVDRLDAAGAVVHSQKYPLLPGDCFVIASDEQHAYVDSRELTVYNILFGPELLRYDLEELRTIPGLSEFLFVEPLFRHEASTLPKLHLSVEERELVVVRLDAIVGACQQRQPGFRISARSDFLATLVLLARASHRQGHEAGDERPRAGQRQAVAAAIAFMEERYADKLSLPEIAARAFLSAHHFSEVFKFETGISPWEFLTKLRIDRAKHLLKTSEASITDVAFTVGFSDSSYFARVFKAEVGKSPRDFRGSE